MKLVGLDIGTTTICGLVADLESGCIVEEAAEPNNTRIPGRGAWEAVQDPEAIFSKAMQITDTFLTRHRDTHGVGITGQMHGILYTNRKGMAVSPLATWEDARGDRQDASGMTCASRLSTALGRQVSSGMGAVTHCYDVLNSQLPEGACALCTIGDYVAMRLAGASSPVVDPTNAASIGCFDLRSLRFREDVLESLGVDPALFPLVDAAYPALGEIRPGVPVFAAVGDNQASFLGAVPDLLGSILVNVGTGSQISAFLPMGNEIPGIDIRPFPFGGYLVVGAALCGGRAYSLLREFFARTLRMFTSKLEEVDWSIMNAVDQNALTGEPLVVDTRFAGTRADPRERGFVGNVGLENFTPEHLVAGVRNGIASELFRFYESFPENVRALSRHLIGSGSGIRQNPDLRRVFEERFGMPLRMARHREEASFGAALLAGIASGVLPGRAAAGALIQYEAT